MKLEAPAWGDARCCLVTQSLGLVATVSIQNGFRGMVESYPFGLLRVLRPLRSHCVQLVHSTQRVLADPDDRGGVASRGHCEPYIAFPSALLSMTWPCSLSYDVLSTVANETERLLQSHAMAKGLV